MNKLVSGSLAIAVSAVVGLAACNSGGGGGDDGTTGGGGALSASAAAQSAFLAVGFTGDFGSGGDSAARVSARRSKDLASTVARLKSNFRSARTRSAAAAVTPSATTDCELGGTQSYTSTATGYTQVFTNCVENETFYTDGGAAIEATLYQNGTVSYSESDDTDSYTETYVAGSSGTPYTYRINRTSDNRLLWEDVENISSTEVFSDLVTCGVYGDAQNITSQLSGTLAFKYDGDADGTLDEDNEATLTTVSLGISQVLDTDTCDTLSETVTLSGTIAAQDNLDAGKSATITIASDSPLTVATTYGATSESSTISGTMTIETACTDATTITLATTTAVVTNYADDCPISGAMTISGDVSATLVFNSDGSMDVGGTHYATCEDAEICS